MDGERLVRFGEAPSQPVLSERGFAGFALLTTPRWHGRLDGAAVVVDVPPGPVAEVARAVFDAVGERPLVALGGGRAIDTAKAIAGVRGAACAAVPTTLSGAEMTPFHRLPDGMQGRLTRPSLVIAHPGLMTSQPPAARTASAMNALAHAVEALYTPLRNPVAEMAALRAIELIGSAAAGAEAEPLALGALLAGYASGAAGFAVHHVVCQTVVRLAGTPHAATNAAVLPHSVRLMSTRARDEIAAVGHALGTDDPAATIERIAGRTGLRSLGFEPDQIAAVVDQAAKRPELHNTPQAPDARALTDLLEAAL